MQIARVAPARFWLIDVLPADLPFWGALLSIIPLSLLAQHAKQITITDQWRSIGVVLLFLLARIAYVILRPRSLCIHTLIENAAALFASAVVFAPIPYLCTRTNYPLQNAIFEQMDNWLEFSWDAWHAFTFANRSLLDIQFLAYNSMIYQLCAAVLILPATRNTTRGYALSRTVAIAISVTCIICYFLPAAMPRAFGNTDWYATFMDLRGSASVTSSMADLKGIVTFPSYHAALAVIITHSLRGLGVITVLFAVLNVAMLISIPLIGYHYFVDIIGGVVVAIASIALQQALPSCFNRTNAAAMSAGDSF